MLTNNIEEEKYHISELIISLGMQLAEAIKTANQLNLEVEFKESYYWDTRNINFENKNYISVYEKVSYHKLL